VREGTHNSTREHMDTSTYVIFAIAILTVGWLAFTEACKKK
jgi:hypothetical protein